MISYVAGLLFTEDHEQVLLIHKKKPAWQAGKLNAIGGKIEEREIPINAMRREFREETGLDMRSWRKFCTLTHHMDAWRVHFFCAFSERLYEARKMEEELPVIVNLPQLPTCIIHNISWLIPMALDPSPVLAEVIEFGERS